MQILKHLNLLKKETHFEFYEHIIVICYLMRFEGILNIHDQILDLDIISIFYEKFIIMNIYNYG